RRRLPRHQGRRVHAEVPAPRGPRAALRRAARRGDPPAAAAAERDVLLALLLHDGPPRGPHDHRRRAPDLADRQGEARRVLAALQHARRPRRPLLALRRHRLDLPVPPALPAREAHAVTHESGTGGTPKAYFAVFAALMGLTGLTVWASFLHLGVWNTPVAL